MSASPLRANVIAFPSACKRTKITKRAAREHERFFTFAISQISEWRRRELPGLAKFGTWEYEHCKAREYRLKSMFDRWCQDGVKGNLVDPQWDEFIARICMHNERAACGDLALRSTATPFASNVIPFRSVSEHTDGHPRSREPDSIESVVLRSFNRLLKLTNDGMAARGQRPLKIEDF